MHPLSLRYAEDLLCPFRLIDRQDDLVLLYSRVDGKNIDLLSAHPSEQRRKFPWPIGEIEHQCLILLEVDVSCLQDLPRLPRVIRYKADYSFL